MNIKGKIVTLRAPGKDDINFIVGMFNDPEMEDLVVGWSFPLSNEQQSLWFEKNISDQKNHRFIIETPEEGPIGIATLTNIDWKNRTATHGIKLANSNNRRKGVGTDAVMALERYVFDELGLHRLDGSRFVDNIASERLYKKCGWKDEGLRRECVYKKGKWRDLVICGITESDYRSIIEENNYWDK